MSPKIAFLGPEATYTHQAVIQQFGKGSDIYPQKSISACFEAIDSRSVDFAVVPYENSTNGQVVFTYDLLRDWFLNGDSKREINSSLPSPPQSSTIRPTFQIVAEQFVPIHHNFLTRANRIEDIDVIYSHPQVWTQVSKFMSQEKINGIKRVDSSSTSKAAEIVSSDASCTSACISSHASSELYNLPALYSDIEDDSKNTTRFLVLGYEQPEKAISQKDTSSTSPESYVTSILFTLNHEPGTLCRALSALEKYNVNLTSITSRPLKTKWQYVFFVELMGSSDEDENVRSGLQDLEKVCKDMVVLGSFQRNWRYWDN